MDTTDIVSDSSESSIKTDCASSVSSISSLSGYQTEFLELKELIDTTKSSIDRHKSSNVDPKRNTVISFYENRIQNLTVQLQNSFKQNEKLKNIIFNLEKKTDISSVEKLRELLKQNSQLEANLKAATNQIQRLVGIHNSKSEQSDQDKILNLEKCNHDLRLQSFSLSNELSQCKYEKRNAEMEQKNLKTEINELSLELAAKAKCVSELKSKITDQHVQIQVALQNNVKLSHSLDSLKSELKHVAKSENWYKSKLHQLQEERRGLNDTILEKNKIISSQEKTLELLKLELNKWKCACDEVRLASLKEKESLLKQFETANTAEPKYKNFHLMNDLQRITDYYEMTIQELNNDVTKLKNNFQSQQDALENLSKENSHLLEQHLSFQSSLKEKDYELEKMECARKHLKINLTLAMHKEDEHNTKLLQLKKHCSDLEVELDVNKREKKNIEESISAIKEQFNLFKSKYGGLKEELRLKNQEILQLQFENSNLKQEILELQRKVTDLIQHENDAKSENCILKQEIDRVNEKSIEMQKKFDNLETEYKDKEEELNTLIEDKERMIQNLENDINILEENITASEIQRNQSNENNNLSVFVETNCANFVLNDTKNIIDSLEHICKLCQLSYGCDDTLNLRRDITCEREYIKILLSKLYNYLQKVNIEVKIKDEALSRKNCIINRIQMLENKCKQLYTKTEENDKLLKIFNDTTSDRNGDVKHLQALLEVKAREQKDKQKKYETNYRTLLRKVKEHMKGRNLAEKHNIYLQEMYNNLSDEYNTLRLQFSQKNSECLGLQNSIAQLKSEVTEMEKKVSMTRNCKNCVQLDESREKLARLLNYSENRNLSILNELKLKEELIDHQQKENQELVIKLSAVNTDYNNNASKIETLIGNNKKLGAKLNNLENILSEEKSLRQILEAKLLEEKEKIDEICCENQQLMKQIDATTDKNSCLLKEIDNLNSDLQLKAEELKELRLRKKELDSNYSTKDTNFQNIIIALKSQLQTYKNEIEASKQEKFFMQRLVNDLKVALKAHVNHNKALKEYLNNMCRENKEECYSLSTTLSNFPSPTRYDDCYINNLLQENNAPLQDQPFSEIQVCLDALRNEITVLQKQIIEKNVLSS